VVEEGDAKEVTGLPETGGEHAILGTGIGVAGRVVVRTCDVKSR
jgi:hypothetical protein